MGDTSLDRMRQGVPVVPVLQRQVYTLDITQHPIEIQGSINVSRGRSWISECPSLRGANASAKRMWPAHTMDLNHLATKGCLAKRQTSDPATTINPPHSHHLRRIKHLLWRRGSVSPDLARRSRLRTAFTAREQQPMAAIALQRCYSRPVVSGVPREGESIRRATMS